MIDPPSEMHKHFEVALQRVRGRLSRDSTHLIDGEDVTDPDLHDDLSPINTEWLLARFPEDVLLE